ncbi:MAG: alpha/beta hydrolase [Sphingobium sp.]
MPLFLAHLWRETENDPILRQAALRGLRRYQAVPRVDLVRPHKVHAVQGSAQLLHLGTGDSAHRQAVVLIPSLVNSHLILDLSDSMSLAGHLAGAGFDPWLIDWGLPDAQDAALDLAGHIEHCLLPLVQSIGRPVSLVGYCLGGTIALGAAALAQAVSVATIAAPWRFDHYPAAEQERIAALWQQSKPLCQRLGYVPMEVLQSGFWSLDPHRTIRKYAAFADMEPDSDAERAFLAVEDWANEGAPLTYAAGCDLFERLYARNDTGSGNWTVGGRKVDPAALPCPSLAIRSITDRIVPAGAAPPLRDRQDSPLGHVGMIVSRKAPEQIWRPLSEWLCNCGQ